MVILLLPRIQEGGCQIQAKVLHEVLVNHQGKKCAKFTYHRKGSGEHPPQGMGNKLFQRNPSPKRGLQYQRNLLYLPEVQWDIILCDFPCVLIKDYQC